MGVEASYQAIPENCELLQQARLNRDLAEWMQHFNYFTRGMLSPHPSQEVISFREAVQQLVSADAGLIDRYFYAHGRNYDAIIFLLCSARRIRREALRFHKVKRGGYLIVKAVRGSELLHPDARATQGNPIGFVPASEVVTIADYLDSVTHNQLHEHYNPLLMEKVKVYKMHRSDDEQSFERIWEEFVGMQNIYRQAANHNEAMITVID